MAKFIEFENSSKEKLFVCINHITAIINYDDNNPNGLTSVYLVNDDIPFDVINSVNTALDKIKDAERGLPS